MYTIAVCSRYNYRSRLCSSDRAFNVYARTWTEEQQLTVGGRLPRKDLERRRDTTTRIIVIITARRVRLRVCRPCFQVGFKLASLGTNAMNLLR